MWGEPYGFCDGGEFTRGTEIKLIESFTLLTLIFSSFAACCGCSVRAAGSKGLHAAACLSLLTWVSAVIAFSVMVTFDWYTDLRSNEGAYMPFYSGSGDSKTLVVQPINDLFFGPTFGMLVTVFICSFYAQISLHGAASKIDEELKESKNSKADYLDTTGEELTTGQEVVFA